jgi:hypothetical protein
MRIERVRPHTPARHETHAQESSHHDGEISPDGFRRW